ncbi:MAG: chromate transporter [Anaerolineae bacterium]|nr:chromate transporter [Anaerolineae bacterium]
MPVNSPPPATSTAPPGLAEIVLFFLKLGVTAFGGPAAHIALMHDELVKRRKWLDEQRFLDLLGATNLIPGLPSEFFCRRSSLSPSATPLSPSCATPPGLAACWME